MNPKLFLNSTSFDVIAMFLPKTPLKFSVKPIILSTGAGRMNFINFEQPQPNQINRTTINGRIAKYNRPVLINGIVTLNAQSLAISAIREILEYQEKTLTPVSGTLYILNIQALQYDQYRNFSFTSPYTGADRDKILSDVKFQFSCLPAVGISGAFASMILSKIQ